MILPSQKSVRVLVPSGSSITLPCSNGEAIGASAAAFENIALPASNPIGLKIRTARSIAKRVTFEDPSLVPFFIGVVVLIRDRFLSFLGGEGDDSTGDRAEYSVY